MGHPASLRILVCGDADRGDNGAPLIAISRLLPSLPRSVLDQVEVRRREQLVVEDLEDLSPGEACLIVDTATGLDPGAIVTISLEDLAGDPRRPIPRSAHLARIDEGIRMVSEHRGAIPPGSFVGIGGRSFGFGVPLSIPVRTALPEFAGTIGLEISRILGVRVTEPG